MSRAILDACKLGDNNEDAFLTLEDVKQEKCLDYATTLLGLDEKAIEEDFKAVDMDGDGKLTLEEGLKAYEYFRETDIECSPDK